VGLNCFVLLLIAFAMFCVVSLSFRLLNPCFLHYYQTVVSSTLAVGNPLVNLFYSGLCYSVDCYAVIPVIREVSTGFLK
jgi:hypothetical protein